MSTKFANFDEFVTYIFFCVWLPDSGIWPNVLNLIKMSKVDKSSLRLTKVNWLFFYAAESPWLSLKTRFLSNFLLGENRIQSWSTLFFLTEIKHSVQIRCKELLLASDQRNSHGKVTSITSYLQECIRIYTAPFSCNGAKQHVNLLTQFPLHCKFYWQCLKIKINNTCPGCCWDSQFHSRNPKHLGML